nr:unnamed protein product [Spirometra erinaceieuropaei]
MFLSTTTVHDLLFAGDYTLNTATEVNIQRSMELFASSCPNFGLTNNTHKMVIVHQLSSNREHRAPRINVNGSQLKNVDSFACVSIALTCCIKTDKEVAQPTIQSQVLAPASQTTPTATSPTTPTPTPTASATAADLINDVQRPCAPPTSITDIPIRNLGGGDGDHRSPPTTALTIAHIERCGLGPNLTLHGVLLYTVAVEEEEEEEEEEE